jgi:hypothetical protein
MHGSHAAQIMEYAIGETQQLVQNTEISPACERVLAHTE